jgi:hypothetical protein
MSETTQRTKLINGQWKVEDEVASARDLIKLAEEWRDGPSGEHYVSLAVRRGGRNQVAIYFEYLYDGTSAGFEKYTAETMKELETRFGKNNVHWDITSSLWRIK